MLTVKLGDGECEIAVKGERTEEVKMKYIVQWRRVISGRDFTAKVMTSTHFSAWKNGAAVSNLQLL